MYPADYENQKDQHIKSEHPVNFSAIVPTQVPLPKPFYRIFKKVMHGEGVFTLVQDR